MEKSADILLQTSVFPKRGRGREGRKINDGREGRRKGRKGKEDFWQGHKLLRCISQEIHINKWQENRFYATEVRRDKVSFQRSESDKRGNMEILEPRIYQHRTLILYHCIIWAPLCGVRHLIIFCFGHYCLMLVYLSYQLQNLNLIAGILKLKKYWAI